MCAMDTFHTVCCLSFQFLRLLFSNSFEPLFHAATTTTVTATVTATAAAAAAAAATTTNYHYHYLYHYFSADCFISY